MNSVKNGESKPMTLNKRLLFAMLLLAAVTTTVFSMTLYHEKRDALMEGMDEKLRTAAYMARATLPTDFHDRLTGPGSVSDAEYQLIVDRYNNLCTTLGMEYLWSLMDVDGAIVFTTATSPDKDAKNRKHAAFFEKHSNPELYTGTFASMKPSYQINDDKWGRIRVVLVPFKDTKGRPYLFGASIRLTEADKQMQRVVYTSILISLGLLVCTFGVGTLLARTMTEPIRKLTETIKAVAEGNTGMIAEKHGSYEQIVLAGSFNRLNRTLQDNIVELKRSEANIKQQTSLMDGLLKSIPDIIFFKDREGVYLGCNPEFARFVGRHEEEIKGRTDYDLFPKDVADFFRTNDRIMMEQGVPRHNEEWIDYPDGSRILIDTLKAPLRALDGEVIGILGVSRNISERKRAEEERRNLELQMQQTQKLESLGVLAGGIAHDFNNILMAIMGNADLALMRINPESPAVDNLKRIEQASARAADLAKQMLAYSGKGKFVVEHLDMSCLVDEMLHMMEVSISKKAVLRLNLTTPLPSVEADATQMRQIIMNLVINASEAIGEKSGVIAIKTGYMECDRTYLQSIWLNENLPAGLYVSLEISDTGCGMDADTLAKLFDPFFTTKFTGRGLGMAAVLGIVRGHNGAIRVYSEPGKGSSFNILLPASPDKSDKSDVSDLSDGWKGSGTVLLVDDEETVRAIGSEMLRELGFQVVTANDGRDALEVFKSRDDIDFVILDLTMPKMDGEQCFRALRQLKPEAKVIMSSGFNQQEVTQKFVGKGLAGFIQKPYRLAALKEVIRGI
jgi:PAS domain S-box-containing protein